MTTDSHSTAYSLLLLDYQNFRNQITESSKANANKFFRLTHLSDYGFMGAIVAIGENFNNKYEQHRNALARLKTVETS